MATEFRNAAPILGRKELDGAFKNLALGYLSMSESESLQSAEIVLGAGSAAYRARAVELTRQ